MVPAGEAKECKVGGWYNYKNNYKKLGLIKLETHLTE
jgi:hypothetical protein